jgi:hypothetical protein
MIGSSGRGARNRSIAQTGSLFPFLAVLICTMGTLVFLLVVVSQYAKTDAAQDFVGDAEEVAFETLSTSAETLESEVASPDPIATYEPESAASEMEGAEAEPVESDAWDQETFERAETVLQWKIESLEVTRSSVETMLTDTRVRLGEVESQVALMQEEATHLQGVLAEMDRRADAEGEGAEDFDSRQAELERLLAEIKLKEDELERLRADDGQRPPVYAIVPFMGRNGTKRRPIYLECRQDGVFYQPGDIELLAPGEFQIADLPSNTIDRVLRSVRDHWNVQSGGELDQGEPYPLLVIRPGGVEAYHVALESMVSWNGEYGYEPVADGFELQFPVQDVELGQRIKSVVDDSRAKHRQALARGIGLGLTLDAASEELPSTTYSASARPGGGIVHASPDLETLGEHVLAEPAMSPDSGGPSEETSLDAAPPPSGQWQSMSNAEASSTPIPPWENYTAEPESETGRRSAIFPDAETRESIFDRDQALPLEGTGLETGTPGVEGTGTQGSAPSDVQNVPEWAPAVEQPMNVESMASARGADWALPGGMRRGTIVRRIRIDLYSDRMIIIDEDNYSVVREIRFQGEIRDVVDRFVPKIWEQIEQWGTAGDEREWQPALSVHVMSGGETRFTELETLFDGSGMLVIRYQQ